MVIFPALSRLFGVVISFLVLIVVSFSAQAQNYTCFPTCENDGRMMTVVSGSTFTTLANEPIGFSLSTQDPTGLDWGIFDADALPSTWDIDSVNPVPPVNQRVAYRLYADPQRTGDTSGAGVVLLEEYYSDDVNAMNNAWWDLPRAHDLAAENAGTYNYLVVVEQVDAQADGVNSFKVRVDGAISISRNQLIGFVGAAYGDGAFIIYPNIPSLEGGPYDGNWEFNLQVSAPPGNPITEFVIWDGDLDYGDSVVSDTDDLNSIGIPDFSTSPEAVDEGAAGADPQDNNPSFGLGVGDPVTYQVTDPLGNVYVNANPSGNVEWEKFEIRTLDHVDGCDVNAVAPAASSADFCVDRITPGLWTVEVLGMDLNNLNTFRFSFDSFPSPIFSGIGNYVWVDENGDGLQDAGEPGIGGVTVRLYDSNGNQVGEAVTDAQGGYYIKVALPGTYTVDVDESTLPVGLTQTQLANAGSDFSNQQEPYTLSVGAGESNLTADFGYNWGDSENNTGDGALGDRVWVDVDGDGVQDAGEPGIGGVELTIYTDSDGNGLIEPGIDAPYAGAIDQDGTTGTGTTVTDADGRYVFSALPPDGYVVVVNPATLPGGHMQTGDPDDFGMVSTNPDNQTTSAVLIEPGDAYLNVDFGYQPDAGTLVNTIGDTVWLDSNADGVQDAAEPGIGGVTVSLLDGNGDAVATDVTDANGMYLFAGLPDGTYSVVVTDTDGVLLGMDQTGDPDGVLDSQSMTSVAGGISDLNQDFGYVPGGHQSGDGLVGDTVWLDIDGDGVEDAGEPGIGGVTVNLYDPTGTVLIDQAVTDSAGFYSFGDLDPAGMYVVEVDTSTLPAGLSNTGDPDGGNDSESLINLSIDPDGVNDGINLDQDFGYIADTPGTIGDLVWLDVNADGVNDGLAGADGIPGTADDEPGIEGVTLDLYVDSNGDGLLQPGEPQLGSTTTDSTGAYLFEGLPGGDYIVDVTDDAGLLNGYWHSLGTADTNDHSQADPYAVNLPDGGAVETADFGYYVALASVGDFIWFDANSDGIQDAGEPGIEGVEVTLTIDYPDGGSQLVLTTVTDADGLYSFNNLLADEDYNGDASDGSPEPVFTITVDTPQTGDGTPMQSSPIDEGSDDALDSDDPNGELAQPLQGQVDDTNDFGFYDVGSISGNVSEDTDRDGSVDDTLPNVVINVYEDADQDGLPDDLNSDGVIDANDLAQDVNGTPLTTLTDADGNYSVEGVPAGSYVVEEEDPLGYTSILDGDITDGGDDLPLNTDIEDNLIPVTLTVDTTLLQAEDDDGNNFVDSPLLAGLGDTVWLDLNADGQDAGEEGIGNVTVTLLDSNGTPIDTALTDGTGFYEFTGLIADTYTVVVDETTLPAGAQQTYDLDDGVTTTPISPSMATVTLTAGEINNNVDFGYQPTNGAITGSVSEDTSGDGQGDTPIATQVQLYADTDGDGQPDGAAIAVVSTDPVDGSYVFTDVAVGDYVVIEVQPGNLVDVSDHDTTDDNDPFDGDTAVDNQIAVTVSVNETDTGNDFVDAQTGTISGTVTEDTDNDGLGDTPIQGVIVELFEDTNGDGFYQAGEPSVMITTTATDGSYSFTDLAPNNYVVVETQPSDANGDPYTSVSDQDQSHDGDVQDDDTTVDESIGVTLNPGESDTENNFVEVLVQGTPSIDIRKQEEGPDVREFAPGDPIDFEIEVTNTGDVDLTNVVVTDPILPVCDSTIGDLAVGESTTYTCSTVAPTYPQVVFEDDFESDTGWVINPEGTDTATSANALWEIGLPNHTAVSVYRRNYQTMQIPYPSGGRSLMTGTGITQYFAHVDTSHNLNGITTARSPAIQIPVDGRTLLDLDYHFGHYRAYPEDYYQIKVIDEQGNATVLVDRRGNNGVGSEYFETATWTGWQHDLTEFNGQVVYLEVVASLNQIITSGGYGQILEAGLDNVTITNYRENSGYVNTATVSGEHDGQSVTDSDDSEVVVTSTLCVLPASFTQTGEYAQITYEHGDVSVVINDYDGTLRVWGYVQEKTVYDEPLWIDVLFSGATYAGTPYGPTLNPDGAVYYTEVSGTMDGAVVSRRGPPAQLGLGGQTTVGHVYGTKLGFGAWFYLDYPDGTQTIDDLAIELANPQDCSNPISVDPQLSVVFEDDFETSTGWVINPGGIDSALEGQGQFEIANPEQTWFFINYAWPLGPKFFYPQFPTNPDGNETGNVLITGALAGADRDANDLDGGFTRARSTWIQLPENGITLIDLFYYFNYYYYANSSSIHNEQMKDALIIQIIDDQGNKLEVLKTHKTGSIRVTSWLPRIVDISSFNGRLVTIEVRARSKSPLEEFATIEAAVDQIRITNLY